VRLTRTKLDFLLAEAKGRPEPPPFANEDEQTSYIKHRGTKGFDELLDSAEWNDLPSLAEATPAAFLQYLWPWYVAVFSEILARSESESLDYVYAGRYVIEIELTPSERSAAREKPLMNALQIAVEELAAKVPDGFSKWAEESSHLEILAVQQLISYGFEVAADTMASRALEWLLLDSRRFQLGTRYGHRRTTIQLVRACAPHWAKEEVGRFEKAVLSYRPRVPERFKEPKLRKLFADEVRATKKDLLQAVGVERLASENRELVATEQRALGDRFDRSMSEVEGGWIGSPMDAAAMAKAKDRDILKIFREVPDNTNWDHPTHWMRGGNIQLSRAFAEFARTDPERAIRLMEHFEPLEQERAAGYALDAMADDARNDSRIIDALLELHARGFQAEEFRNTAARATEKIARRNAGISDEVIGILVDWLRLTPALAEEGAADEDIELTRSKDEDLKEGSILWGHGYPSVLPGGNFNILSALASILLNRQESDRNRYLAILNDHFSRERDPNIWRALLYRLGNAGGSTQQVVSTFLRKLFDRFPEILTTREAIILLAHAQRWDHQLVFDLISNWHKSGRPVLERAYGELVGLVATVKEKNNWAGAQHEIITSGTDDMKIGLAHTAADMWSDEKLRLSASVTLVALLKGASKDLVAAVMDVFMLTDELAPDAPTVELLRALADASTDMSAVRSHFVVERLQALLPHEAELVATIAEKLIAVWGSELGDIRTGTTDVSARTRQQLGSGLRGDARLASPSRYPNR